MLNKKSTGIQWDVALLVFIIGVGILMYTTGKASIPKIGEYALNSIKSLESGKSVPITVKKIMEKLNQDTTTKYENHRLFTLNSYCIDINDADKDGDTTDATPYKEGLRSGGVTFDPPDDFSKRNPVKCYVEEEELFRYYEEKFSLEYESFKAAPDIWSGSNLDFSTVTYTPLMKKESGNYYNEIKTGDTFERKIIMKKDNKDTEIGKFWISPDFKIKTPNPATGPFDTTEVCIFSNDCGATCELVIQKNSRSLLEIKDEMCQRYDNCYKPAEAIDDFNEDYSCSGDYLCSANPTKPVCIPFCSESSVELITDDDLGLPDAKSAELTQCNEFSCGKYMYCEPVSTHFESTCSHLCMGKGKGCIGRVNDGTTDDECSVSFVFEDNDHCICGLGSVERAPFPHPDASCNAICNEISEKCIMGIDDGNKYRKCDKPFGFEGSNLDDYCICGLGTREDVPAPSSNLLDTCTNRCGPNKCIIGVDDGNGDNKNRKCDQSFTFEDGQNDDYCICSSGSKEVFPYPHADASCNTICGLNRCIMGIDDGDNEMKCNTPFGFEGNPNDDYCICGLGSDETGSGTSCGCPDKTAFNPDTFSVRTNACTGNECDTLHCDRDPNSYSIGADTIDGKKTHCRDLSCGEYHDCSTESLSCNCDAGSNECKGSCPKCWSSEWSLGDCGGSSGGVTCGATRRIKTRKVMPSSCKIDAKCSGCDTTCDTACSCDRGSQCGPCGKNTCACGSDGDPNTNCKDFPCNNYVSCSATSSCACSSSNACTGGCTTCSGLQTCGVGKTCDASSCGGTCSDPNKPTQCLSGEQVVCCDS